MPRNSTARSTSSYRACPSRLLDDGWLKTTRLGRGRPTRLRPNNSGRCGGGHLLKMQDLSYAQFVPLWHSRCILITESFLKMRVDVSRVCGKGWFMKNRFLASSAIMVLALAGAFSISALAQTTDEGTGPTEQPSAPIGGPASRRLRKVSHRRKRLRSNIPRIRIRSHRTRSLRKRSPAARPARVRRRLIRVWHASA